MGQSSGNPDFEFRISRVATVMTASQIIIDGNNLLHAWRQRPAHARDFAAGRHALARWLSQLSGEFGASVLVVFDGRIGGNDISWSGSGVDVLYAAAGASADAVIEQRVQETASKGLLVVSSDLAIQRSAAASGAEVMSCAQFIAWAEDAARTLGERVARTRIRGSGSRLGDFFPPGNAPRT
jgi:predicted RNA-binding protein with PIN domain